MNIESTRIQIKCFDHFDAISLKDWDALLAVSPTRSIFQTMLWQKAWWKAYGQSVSPWPLEYKLCLLAGYKDQALVVIAPLVCRGNVLYFIGDGVADRLDFLYDPSHGLFVEDILSALKLKYAWESLALNGIPDASPTWRHLKGLRRDHHFFPITVSKQILWGFVMEGKEERVRRHLHAGTLSKHAAIFSSKGAVTVRHQKAPEMDALLWHDFMIQHIYRWSLRALPSMFVMRAARDLCRFLIEDPKLRVNMVMTSLCLDGRVAAYHLGFIYEKIFYWQMPAFDVRLKRFCPDDVLWREVMAYAFQCGCKEVAFTSSEEPVVRRFSDRLGVTRCVRVFHRRRDEWRARLVRWMGRFPLAIFSYRLIKSGAMTLKVIFYRKKMVKAARLSMEGVGSFADLYMEPQAPDGFNFSLAKPEVEIIRRLRPELKDMAMLDMGVGFGRTSVYFSSAVKRYDAFDCVPARVALARADLSDLKDCRNIIEENAVSMKSIAAAAYDFILFSADGIDEASQEDRLKIFKEVRRVGKEGALFFYSSRNLQGLSYKISRGPLDLLYRFRRHLLMAAANESLSRSRFQGSAFLVDEKSGYKLQVYFGTPKEEVRVLKELGFSDVRVFSMRTGLEVRDWRRWDKLADESLYYLCRV